MSEIYARFQVNKTNFNFDIDLAFPSSGITSVFGPSGSGKTTFLRALAGLDSKHYQVAKLVVNGNTWHDQKIFLPAYQRAVGFVFQEVNLFEHLNVIGNIKFGFNRTRNPNQKLLEQTIELFGLKALLERKVEKLSGGEKQRVGLARAIAVNPEILLMDEPLASLDYERKNEIMPYLEKLHEELDIPIVYVTHSIDEVMRLADYLILLKEGKVSASGEMVSTIAKINHWSNWRKETAVVLECNVAEIDQKWHLAKLAFEGGFIWVKDLGWQIGQKRRVRIMAQDVSLALEVHPSTIQNIIQVEVIEVKDDPDHPASVLVWLKPCDLEKNQNNIEIISAITKKSLDNLNIKIGTKINAQIKSVAVIN